MHLGRWTCSEKLLSSVSIDTLHNLVTWQKVPHGNAITRIVSSPHLAVFAPIEQQASTGATSLVLPVQISQDDVTLAAILMEILKLYASGQIASPGPAPPVPNPLTPESSGQSSAVLQSDSTTAPAVGRADSLHVYRMSSTPCGLAVIINNEKFIGELGARMGSHIDAKNLRRLFSWLGYKVMLFVNLTAEEILSTVQQLASLDHTYVDSVVLCILTHGEFGKLYGMDGEGVPTEKVFEPFNGENSPTLAGKPKIFLIAANRGKENDQGVEVPFPHPHNDGDTELSGKDRRHAFGALKAATEALSQKEGLKCEGLGHEGDVQVLPVEADFVIVYATPPGYVSWRNSVFGTWFIKAFVDVMFQHAAKCHFLEILTFLNNQIGMKFQSRDGYKQIAETTFRLMKLLYFNPPQPSSLPPVAQPGTDTSEEDIPVSHPADPQWPLLFCPLTVADADPEALV